jgi:hypothetical protein
MLLFNDKFHIVIDENVIKGQISYSGGRDTVEEYLACGQYPLSIYFRFGEIHDGVTPVSKLTVPLRAFHAA